jgi:hypothetical protein
VAGPGQGVAAALGAVGAGARPLLLLAHDDCSLRVWDVDGRAQLLHEDMHPEAHARALAPARAVLAGGVPGDALLVVAELVPQEGDASRGGAARLGGGLLVALQLGASGPGGRLVAEGRLELPVPGGRAALVDARVANDVLWVLCRSAEGAARVLSYSLEDGAYMGAAQMLQPSVDEEWGAGEVRR